MTTGRPRDNPRQPIHGIAQPSPSFVYNYASDYADAWCVYEHSRPNEAGEFEVIYYGVIKLVDLYTFGDAVRNSEWIAQVKPSTNLATRLLYTGDRHDCYQWRGKLPNRPICNLRGFDTIGVNTGITCNETGTFYNNQGECAKALNINQGALSAHLNRKAGYYTVKGYTFRKGK